MLSDVHMPDMDGFKLLEHIALELDIPVMSESTQPSLHPPTTPLKIWLLIHNGPARLRVVLARPGRVHAQKRVAFSS